MGTYNFPNLVATNNGGDAVHIVENNHTNTWNQPYGTWAFDARTELARLGIDRGVDPELHGELDGVATAVDETQAKSRVQKVLDRLAALSVPVVAIAAGGRELLGL